MKQLTQQEKFSIVMNSDELSPLYLSALNKQGIKYCGLGKSHKIGNKRVGIQKLILTQKRIAASIYDNQNK